MPDLAFDLPTLLLSLRGLALLILAFWLLLTLARRRWWPADWSLHLESAAQQVRPEQVGELVVVVPARNEAATLPRTLPRLLKQHAWFRRLVVVDDRSEDQTASAVERLGHGVPGASKLHVERIRERREGWSGKVWAMKRGLDAATDGWEGDPSRQWVLFTDADILHPTTSLSRLLLKGDEGEYDLVSVLAKLRADSFAARLLIPAYVYFFQLLYPFRKASDPAARTAAAAGGCLLIRRSVIEEIGGLEAIRDRVIDDVSLARLAKRSGARCWLGLDPDVLSLRVYAQIGDVVALVARTAFEQLGRHYVLVPLVIAVLLALFTGPLVLPAVGLLLRDPWIFGPPLAALLLQVAHYLAVVQYLGVPTGYALTMPIAAPIFGWMTWVSAWRHLTGRRAPWRENVEHDATHG